jgi:hypothetical protein
MTDLLIPTDFEETLTLTGERVSLTVGTYSPNLGQRREWWHCVTIDNEHLVHSGNDLSGFGSAAEMMETFTGFLSAWAESVEWSKRTGQVDSDLGDLFPTALYPLIVTEIDDLTAESDLG